MQARKTSEASSAEPATRKRYLLVIAGEASSDLHCASMIRELKELRPELSFVGVGGENMRAEGVELIAHVRDLGVIGFSEVIGKWRRIVSAFRAATALVDCGEIIAAILVDYPDFNLRVAKRAAKRGVPVIYYISPQVWAWRRSRINKMARLVDLMLVLFRFEEQIYREARIRVQFVGHPLLDTVRPGLPRDKFLDGAGLDPQRVTIAILPGSRPTEVERLLPIFIEGLRIAQTEQSTGTLQAVLPLANTIKRRTVEGMLPAKPPVAVVQGQTYDALAASDLAIIASGTATLEAAILGVPMIVGYAVSMPTYVLGRMMVKVRNIALPNIIAGKMIVPELVQRGLSPSRLAEELLDLIRDRSKRERQKEELGRVKAMLGEPGASKRAALAISGFLQERYATGLHA